jgi:hypothetical protein
MPIGSLSFSASVDPIFCHRHTADPQLPVVTEPRTKLIFFLIMRFLLVHIFQSFLPLSEQLACFQGLYSHSL